MAILVIPTLDKLISDPTEKLHYILNIYMASPKSHVGTMSKDKTMSLAYTLSRYDGTEANAEPVETAIESDITELVNRNMDGGIVSLTVAREQSTEVFDSQFNIAISVTASDQGQVVRLDATTTVTADGRLVQQLV